MSAIPIDQVEDIKKQAEDVKKQVEEAKKQVEDVKKQAEDVKKKFNFDEVETKMNEIKSCCTIN